MFHVQLKKLRERANFSREHLAKSLDISYSALSKYETGVRQPDFDTLLKFADFFGVSTDYLLTGEESGQLTILPNESGVYEFSENTRFPIRFKQALEQSDMDIERLANILEVDVAVISNYLKVPTLISFREEEMNLLNRIALILNTSLEYLLGRDNNKNHKMENDEKDIAKRLKEFEKELENSDGLAFDGEPMSDEAKESLLESMELLFRQTQRINKKYTPKKYRDD